MLDRCRRMNKETNNFKEQLAEHYQQQQLSAPQIAKLQSLSASVNPNKKYLRSATGNIFAAIAASAVIAVSWYLLNFNQQDYTAISQEIAYNHNSKMQMEVFSPHLKTVQGHLNRLGFNLVNSSKLEKDKWRIIGGRYCNINGKIAAQMKLKHTPTDAIYTFYQAKMPGDFIENLTEREVVIDGVKVKLWREKGLLMGLAF